MTLTLPVETSEKHNVQGAVSVTVPPNNHILVIGILCLLICVILDGYMNARSVLLLNIDTIIHTHFMNKELFCV